jgi:hypothetical protein
VRRSFALAVLMVALCNASAFGQRERVQPAASVVDEGTTVIAPVQSPTASRLRRDIERTNLGWLALLGLPGLVPAITHETLTTKPKRR